MSDDKKLKPYEGAVDVNGDTTPISRQPIKSIERAQWHTMNLDQLWEQKDILTQRLQMASRQSPQFQQSIQAGIYELDAVMANKFGTDDTISLR